MELTSLAIALLVSFASSFIGTNVGGGGLIVVPMLIFLGLPAQIAVGTSRFGALASASAGMWKFHKGGKVDFRIGLPIALLSIMGAYAGSRTLLVVPTEFLEKILGLCILLVLLILLFRRGYGVQVERHRGTFRNALGYFLFFFTGFWGAFFGGGSAIFANLILTSCFGLTFLECAGTRKVATIGMAVTSVTVYILAGVVDYAYGAALLIGGSLGASAGAHYGLRKGDAWVRKLFLIVVFLSALELLL